MTGTPIRLVGCVVGVLLSLDSMAGNLVPDIPKAYRTIAATHNVPERALFAIALQESGKGIRHGKHRLPWPWATNDRGIGHYFGSRLELYRYLSDQLAAGNDRFDVGPMEINWHWNSHLFNGNLWAATDPAINIHTGARHLRSLLDHHGELAPAIAAYHAGSAAKGAARERGQRYQARVARIMARIGEES